jgi:lysozyme
MQTSPAGRVAIARREGNVLKAYRDTKGIWTIGVGHTAAAGSPAPKAGMTITAAQSDEILTRDLANVEAAVNSAVKVPVSQGQFDALVSLAFNIGNSGFKKSTLVKRLNTGDVAGAAEAFMMWNKPPEIIGRRKTEQKQFLDGSKPAPPQPSIIPDKPSVVTITPQDKGPPVITVTPAPSEPASKPTSSKAPGAIATIAMLVALAVGAFWDHVTAFFWSIF